VRCDQWMVSVPEMVEFSVSFLDAPRDARFTARAEGTTRIGIVVSCRGEVVALAANEERLLAGHDLHRPVRLTRMPAVTTRDATMDRR
jgi:hypothetical protein